MWNVPHATSAMKYPQRLSRTRGVHTTHSDTSGSVRTLPPPPPPAEDDDEEKSEEEEEKERPEEEGIERP